MGAGRLQKAVFGGMSALLLLFLYLPLAIIVLYAFNKSNINAWPFPGFSTRWFDKAFHDDGVRSAVWLSIRIALVATSAIRTDSQTALRTSLSWNIWLNQRVENPGNGHALMFDLLNA